MNRPTPCPFLPAVHAGADTKLGTEGAVEVRHVAEAAIEGEVDYPRGLRSQSHRGFSQPRPEHVLMRRDTSQTLERAEEVVRAETRLPCQASKGEHGIGFALDHPHGSRHSRHSTR